MPKETVSFALLPGFIADVFLPATWKLWSFLPLFFTENVTLPTADVFSDSEKE